MEYKNFVELNARVNHVKKKTAVVAAAHDAHALEAVLKAAGEGLVEYILVGNKLKIIEIGRMLGHSIESSAIVETPDHQTTAAKSVQLIREKKGDFLMKGILETATLMREVVNRDTGIRTDSTMSHVAILEAPAYHKLLAVTDGGMIPYPTLKQKKMITQNAVELLHALGYDQPKIALLAASESISPKMPETADAGELSRMAREGVFGDCIAAGPISFDLAISRESAEIKGFESPVTQDVDILVVPNIACGNILLKSMLYMGGAKMAGCVVGAKVPIVMTSRGATAEEKHLSILLSAASANH